MNRKSAWLSGAVLLCAQLTVGRAGEPGVAVADMERIFMEHRRLNQIITQVNDQDATQAEERKLMASDLDRRRLALRQITLDAQNATLTEAERSRRSAEAERKLQDLRAAEARLQRLDETHRRQLARRLQELRQRYFVEIQAHIRAYAVERHLALVLDSSPVAAQNGAGGILYADAPLDITAAIITRVNQPQPTAATTATTGPQK